MPEQRSSEEVGGDGTGLVGGVGEANAAGLHPPPVGTWHLTTTDPPSRAAASAVCSGVVARSARGSGTPAARRSALASHSTSRKACPRRRIHSILGCSPGPGQAISCQVAIPRRTPGAGGGGSRSSARRAVAWLPARGSAGWRPHRPGTGTRARGRSALRRASARARSLGGTPSPPDRPARGRSRAGPARRVARRLAADERAAAGRASRREPRRGRRVSSRSRIPPGDLLEQPLGARPVLPTDQPLRLRDRLGRRLGVGMVALRLGSLLGGSALGSEPQSGSGPARSASACSGRTTLSAARPPTYRLRRLAVRVLAICASSWLRQAPTRGGAERR